MFGPYDPSLFQGHVLDSSLEAKDRKNMFYCWILI